MDRGFQLLFLNMLARKDYPFLFRMLLKLNSCSSFCRKMLTVKRSLTNVLYCFKRIPSLLRALNSCSEFSFPLSFWLKTQNIFPSRKEEMDTAAALPPWKPETKISVKPTAQESLIVSDIMHEHCEFAIQQRENQVRRA